MSLRKQTLIKVFSILFFLMGVMVVGQLIDSEKISTDLLNRNIPPSFSHFFGTDWLGRDMFTRTIMGLSLSLKVGIVGTVGSTLIAVIFGVSAGLIGGKTDQILSWVIDLFLSVPHLVTLILLTFSLGGGIKGITIGLIVTHWPSLARIIRIEVMQVRSSDYLLISQKLGKKRKWIAIYHVMPHVIPQIIVGFVLLFPHVILHEAAVTFLGLGISPHEPAIGIILSESMKYLSSGMWWLAFFPGICLLLIVRLFDSLGDNITRLIDPN